MPAGLRVFEVWVQEWKLVVAEVFQADLNPVAMRGYYDTDVDGSRKLGTVLAPALSGNLYTVSGDERSLLEARTRCGRNPLQV